MSTTNHQDEGQTTMANFHNKPLGGKIRHLEDDARAIHDDGADANLPGLADTLHEVAAEADNTVADVLRLAALVSNAALKHTAGPTRHDDRGAVGRLHNAAKLARSILDRTCPMCNDAKTAGIPAIDRAGECAGCTRLLGDLGGRQ